MYYDYRNHDNFLSRIFHWFFMASPIVGIGLFLNGDILIGILITIFGVPIFWSLRNYFSLFNKNFQPYTDVLGNKFIDMKINENSIDYYEEEWELVTF